ncbi:MAG: NADH-quinone oxidoreductase subunit C [Chthoniobacterales bacterium]
MEAAAAIAKLKEKFAPSILEENFFRDEYTLAVAKESLHEICAFARETLGFDYLIDISSVDHFGEEPRFEVVYELYSMASGIHLRLKTPLSEDAPELISVIDIWPTADWHEREVWDMMGITFNKHPDLRRILMWEGYPYHPLRKDFPLEGKASEVEGVAFTRRAPLAGGPFVTVPTDETTVAREPRSRSVSGVVDDKSADNLPPDISKII